MGKKALKQENRKKKTETEILKDRCFKLIKVERKFVPSTSVDRICLAEIMSFY